MVHNSKNIQGHWYPYFGLLITSAQRLSLFDPHTWYKHWFYSTLETVFLTEWKNFSGFLFRTSRTENIKNFWTTYLAVRRNVAVCLKKMLRWVRTSSRPGCSTRTSPSSHRYLLLEAGANLTSRSTLLSTPHPSTPPAATIHPSLLHLSTTPGTFRIPDYYCSQITPSWWQQTFSSSSRPGSFIFLVEMLGESLQNFPTTPYRCVAYRCVAFLFLEQTWFSWSFYEQIFNVEITFDGHCGMLRETFSLFLLILTISMSLKYPW